ncbi:T9SS type A sorting domain-containing protein [candidate division KSB1 bacterium]|nr:T9SS type A sorting domain-containing protein [candidate division KSB1 bacterium]
MNSDFKRIGFENGNGTTSEPRSYQFVDSDLPEGTYIYRLKQIDFDGTSVFSHTAEVTIGLPADFELYQNYPNPFNPITTISYSLPQSGHVELSIYNVKGEKVNKLVDEYQKSGKYDFQWNARDWNGTEVSSGIYYVQIKALNTTQFRKMTLMR